MGRRHMEPGEHGNITSYPMRDGKRLPVARGRIDFYRARTRYVGPDGVRREAMSSGRTRAEAEAAVERLVRERCAGDGSSSGRWTGSTLLVDAAADYLARLADRPDRSRRTVSVYRTAYSRAIAADGSLVRGLRLAQCDVWTLENYLQRVADEHGIGTAKHVKALLSGTFADALRYRVIDHNPMRDVPTPRTGKVSTVKHNTKRALSADEVTLVLATADRLADEAREAGRSPRTVRRAESTALLCALLAGTGMRISEALSVRWGDLDLSTGRLHIRGTKTAAADRWVTLPGWLRERLSALPSRSGYVCHSPALLDAESRWESGNAGKRVKAVLSAAGFEGVASHVFRKSVVTRLLEAGQPAHRVADQVGHTDPSFTLRTYAGRDSSGDKADLAALL